MKKIFNKSINDSENLPVQIGKSISLKYISNVTIDSVIAEGGFSIVYLAKFENQTTKTKEKCALKRLVINSSQDLTMCKREIDIMKALKAKPNVVNLIDYKIQRLSSDYDEEYDGTKGSSIYEIFLLMNYYPNNLLQEINAKLKDMNNTQSLSQSTTVLVNQQSLRMVLDESHICTIFTDLCRAVSYLHEKQPTSKNQILHTSGPIIHRDLKIENILKNVGTNSYVLCDFGSCVYETEYVELYRECSEVKRNMSVMEDDIKKNTTLAYRSPEMVDLYSGYPITIKADIWALGCLLYKLCYLSTPFGENTLAIMEARFEFPNIAPCSEKNKLSQTKTTVPSKYLKTLIKSMLQANPDDRPTISTVLQCIIALKEYHLSGKLSHNIDDMLLKKQRPMLNKECKPSLDVSDIERRRIGNSTSDDKLDQNYNTSIIPRQRPATKKMASSDKLSVLSINPTNTSVNDKKQADTVESNSKQKFDPFLSQNMEASDDIGKKTEAVNSLQNNNPENQIPNKIVKSTLATTQSFDDSFDMNEKENTIYSKTSAQKDVWDPFSNQDMESSSNSQFNQEPRNPKNRSNSITSSSYSSDGSSQCSTEINCPHRFDNKNDINKNISSDANNSHTYPYNFNSKLNTLCAANFNSSQDSLNQQLLLDGNENEDSNMLESISTGNKKFTTDQHTKNCDYHRDFLPRTLNKDENGKNHYDSDFKREDTFNDKFHTRKDSLSSSSSQSSSSDSNPESFSDNNESDHYTNRLKSQSGFCMSHSSPEITRSKFQRLLNPTEEGGFQTSGNNSFNNSSTLINDEIVWKLCANKENTTEPNNMHNPTTSLLTNKTTLTNIPSSTSSIQNSIYCNAQLTCNNTTPINTNNLFVAFDPTNSTKLMVEGSLNTVPTNPSNNNIPHVNRTTKEDPSWMNLKYGAVQEIFHDHPPPPREKPPTLPQSFLATKNENGEFKNESYHKDAFPSNAKAHRRRPSYDLHLSSNNTNTSNQSSSFDIYSSSINYDSNASNVVGKLENSNTKSRLLESNFQSVANKLLAQTTSMNNPSPSDAIANNISYPNYNITTNPTRLVIAPHKIKLKSSQSFMQRKKPEKFFYSNKDVVKTHGANNNNSNTSIEPNFKIIEESNKKGNNAESFTFSDEHFPAFSGTLNAKKSAYGKLIEDPVVLGNKSSIHMDNYLPQNDSKTTTKLANLSVKTKHFTLPTSGMSCNDTKKTILSFNSKITNGNGLNAQKSKSDSYRTLNLDHYTVGTCKELINNLDLSNDSSTSVFQEHLITSNDKIYDKPIKTTIASSLVGSSLTFCRTAGRFSRNKIALQQNSKSNCDMEKSSHKNVENESEINLNGGVSVSDIVDDMESCLSLCKFLPTASNIQNQSLNDLADVFNDNLTLNRLNTGKETTVKEKFIIENSMKYDKPSMLNDKKSKKYQMKSNVGESVPSSFNNVLFDVEPTNNNKNILDYNENMMDFPLNFNVQNTSIQNKSNVLGSTPSNKKTEKLFTLQSPVAAINYGFSDR